MKLLPRLARLEDRLGTLIRACPQCGGAPGLRRGLVLDHDHEIPLNQQCPSCGRVLVLTLAFDSRE